MTSYQKGLLYLLLSQIIWGINPSVLKAVDYAIPVTVVVFLRLVIGSFFLLTIILLVPQQKRGLSSLSKKDVGSIVFLGIIASGITDLLLTQSVRYSGAIISTLIARLEIPVTVLLAVFLLKEKLTKQIIFATILSTLGMIFISLSGTISIADMSHYYLGLGLAFIAAVLWGYGTILAKNILSDLNVSPIIVTLIRLFTGSVITFLILLSTNRFLLREIISIPPYDWAKIMFMGVFASAGAFYFYYKGLKLVPANQASIMLSVSIGVNIIVATGMGEVLHGYQWLGVASIIGAVLMLTVKNKA